MTLETRSPDDYRNTESFEWLGEPGGTDDSRNSEFRWTLSSRWPRECEVPGTPGTWNSGWLRDPETVPGECGTHFLVIAGSRKSSGGFRHPETVSGFSAISEQFPVTPGSRSPPGDSGNRETCGWLREKLSYRMPKEHWSLPGDSGHPEYSGDSGHPEYPGISDNLEPSVWFREPRLQETGFRVTPGCQISG